MISLPIMNRFNIWKRDFRNLVIIGILTRRWELGDNAEICYQSWGNPTPYSKIVDISVDVSWYFYPLLGGNNFS